MIVFLSRSQVEASISIVVTFLGIPTKYKQIEIKSKKNILLLNIMMTMNMIVGLLGQNEKLAISKLHYIINLTSSKSSYK